MKIILLGSGRVATQLGQALKQAGEEIIQVYSPTEAHASALANKLSTAAISNTADLRKDADLYIISVNDDAIAALAGSLNLPGKIVVHTSGSTPMDVLNPASDRIGVFYPLQTFSFGKSVDFTAVPLALEANSPEVLAVLQTLAEKISRKVIVMSSKQRMALHISAVFACNFSNHLYALAQQLLARHQLDFDLLRPLIAETAAKVQDHLPAEVQTGPAIREDMKTLAKHLELLKQQPHLQEIYRLLSQSIVNLQ
ncbi:MAG: Rossmann-like and DUF2520 domain-containing protein [Sphingobacteriaceae bacterium]